MAGLTPGKQQAEGRRHCINKPHTKYMQAKVFSRRCKLQGCATGQYFILIRHVTQDHTSIEFTNATFFFTRINLLEVGKNSTSIRTPELWKGLGLFLRLKKT